MTARHADHVWHVDLTVVPTCAGFWTPWLPFSVPQSWPFCWWVAVVVDHFTRAVAGFAVFKRQPSSEDVRRFLSRAMRRRKARPAHIVSDRGPQFDCAGFRSWARQRKIRLRYGAVGRYGSIAIVERFIRSMKTECFVHCLVPFRLSEMRQELACYATWFNDHRPHQGLGGRTPAEKARDAPRWSFETRGKDGVRLALVVSRFRGRRHLPVVELDQAA